MFDYALVYVKRCQAAVGTTQYPILKKIAEELIDSLDSNEEQDRLRTLLSSSLSDVKLEIPNPLQVTFEYWRERDPGSDDSPIDDHDQLHKNEKRIINHLQALLLKLYDITALYDELAMAEQTSDSDKDYKIIDIYESIESENMNFSRMLYETQRSIVSHSIQGKYLCLFQFMQALYYLANEYSHEYAYRYLPKLPANTQEVPAGLLFPIVESFIFSEKSKLRQPSIVMLLEYCDALYRQSKNLFNYFRTILAEHSPQCESSLEWVFLFTEICNKNFTHVIINLSRLKIFHEWAQAQGQSSDQKYLLEYTFLSLSAMSPPMDDPFVKSIIDQYLQENSAKISRFHRKPESSDSLDLMNVSSYSLASAERDRLDSI